MEAIVTIVDSDHLPQAAAALFSAKDHAPDVDLFCLVTTRSTLPDWSINLLGLSDLESPTAKAVSLNYQGDELRWALKPCVLNHLLTAYDRVAYCDSDFLFVGDWSAVEFSGTLLTPHWRGPKEKWAYLHGLYNAGFVATEDKDAMNWWAELCLWKMERTYTDGLFVDQKYLDQMPLHFPVTVCTDKGMNIGPWHSHREDPKCVHLSTRHQMDETFAAWVADYDKRVAAADCPAISRSNVWMIAQKIGAKWIGPAAHQTFDKQGAEEALTLFQQGLLGEGEFKVMPLPYSSKSATSFHSTPIMSNDADES